MFIYLSIFESTQIISVNTPLVRIQVPRSELINTFVGVNVASETLHLYSSLSTYNPMFPLALQRWVLLHLLHFHLIPVARGKMDSGYHINLVKLSCLCMKSCSVTTQMNVNLTFNSSFLWHFLLSCKSWIKSKYASTQMKATDWRNSYCGAVHCTTHNQRTGLLKLIGHILNPERVRLVNYLLLVGRVVKCALPATSWLQSFKHNAYFEVPQCFDFPPKLFDREGKNIRSKFEKKLQTKFWWLEKTN